MTCSTDAGGLIVSLVLVSSPFFFSYPKNQSPTSLGLGANLGGTSVIHKIKEKKKKKGEMRKTRRDPEKVKKRSRRGPRGEEEEGATS